VGSEGTLAAGTSTGQQSLFPVSALLDSGSLDCGSNPGLCTMVTGTGTVLDIVDMTDTTTLSAGGSSKSFAESASGAGDVTIIYTYTPGVSVQQGDATPEPASVLLFGTGLLVMTGVWRKRSRSQLEK